MVPDLAIIDLEMPKINGYDAILKIHTQFPEIKTIVFSGFLNSGNPEAGDSYGGSFNHQQK